MTILDLSEVRKLAEFDETPEDELLVTAPETESFTAWQRALLRVGMALAVVPVGLWLLLAVLGTIVGALTASSWTDRIWRSARLAAAALSACVVGIFSVQFGITILCVYLLIHVDEREGRLAAFLRSSVQEAFHKF